jgi:hypothetical protein
MKLVPLMAFLVVLSGWALEIEMRPEKKIEVTNSDVEAIKEYTRKRYRFIMNEDGARKVVRENRILANEYVRQGLLSKKERDLIRIEVEKKLADAMVSKIQRRIRISDEVAKSYYKDHLDEFKKPDEIKIVRYRFKRFDDAVEFYKGSKKGVGEKKDLGWKRIDSLKPAYRSFIEKGKEGYYLPPIIVGKNVYDVLYIEKYKNNDSKHIPYEEVKEKIKDLLYKKTFDRERAKILERYDEM